MKDFKKMIADMSLEEKALQLSQVAVSDLISDAEAVVTGISKSVVEREKIDKIGSALNFSGLKIAEQLREFFQAQTHPILLMQDVIYGYKTVYPLNIAIGCSFNLELAEACAEMAAKEARCNGVNVTFAPMVDLVRDARWGRVSESTGEDPYLNGLMGRAFIRGFHKGGIACCVKHFAAYGAAEAGRDYNTTDISDHALKEYYLKSYLECLKEQPEMIMTSFNLLNGVPINGHGELLIGLLREQEKFDGVVISDYDGIGEMINHGYASDLKECALISANNEIDIDMCSLAYAKHLPELVQEGKVSEEKVDRMVERVLALKDKVGLYENPRAGISKAQDESYCFSEEARKIARCAAEEGSVLLANNGVLPLKKETSVCLIGPYASEKELMGEWKCLGKAEYAVSIREGIEKLLKKSVPALSVCGASVFETDESSFGEALWLAEKHEVIVACLGEHHKESGESHSRCDIGFPELQVKLLKRLHALGKKIVLVLFAGRPLVLTEIASLADAILYVWHPGVEGGNAVANLLYGEVNPSGKITMSFPRRVGQCPVYYNYFSTGRPKNPDTMENYLYSTSYLDELNSPLYPFGYGLSYTKFELSDLRLSKNTMRRGDTAVASVRLKNAGARKGKEVVQFYLHDLFGSCARPVKELKGFVKVSLGAKEEQIVTFEITEETLKYYTVSGDYKAEMGEFEIMVGLNSRDTLSLPLKLID